MPIRTTRANAAKSTVRVRIEHVFARQKNQMGLFIRTIGIVHAGAKVTPADLAHNIDRLIFHERRLPWDGRAQPMHFPVKTAGGTAFRPPAPRPMLSSRRNHRHRPSKCGGGS